MEVSLERIELKWQGRVYRKEIKFRARHQWKGGPVPMLSGQEKKDEG
jgi:hypothetical protein